MRQSFSKQYRPQASEDPPAYNAIARRPSLMQATFRGSRTSLLRGSDKGSKSHLGDLTADVIKDKLETAQEQEEEEGEVVDQADGEPASPSAEVVNMHASICASVASFLVRCTAQSHRLALGEIG